VHALESFVHAAHHFTQTQTKRERAPRGLLRVKHAAVGEEPFVPGTGEFVMETHKAGRLTHKSGDEGRVWDLRGGVHV